MLREVLSIGLVAVFLVGCGDVSSSPTSLNTNIESSADLLKSDFQLEILKAINKARSESRDCHDGKGVVGPSEPLIWNTQLYLSAYEHSSDLAQSNTFSHYGSGTESDITAQELGISKSFFYQRIENNGYVEYNILGENIAGGQKNIEEVMKAWLNSPKHCANIMNNDFKEIGVAVVIEEGSEYGIYWTQNFGG